jgi:hypothetical protein
MPVLQNSFAGIEFASLYANSMPAGSPPDPKQDVGLDHYIQTVAVVINHLSSHSPTHSWTDSSGGV